MTSTTAWKIILMDGWELYRDRRRIQRADLSSADFAYGGDELLRLLGEDLRRWPFCCDELWQPADFRFQLGRKEPQWGSGEEKRLGQGSNPMAKAWVSLTITSPFRPGLVHERFNIGEPSLSWYDMRLQLTHHASKSTGPRIWQTEVINGSKVLKVSILKANIPCFLGTGTPRQVIISQVILPIPQPGQFEA